MNYNQALHVLRVNYGVLSSRVLVCRRTPMILGLYYTEVEADILHWYKDNTIRINPENLQDHESFAVALNQHSPVYCWFGEVTRRLQIRRFTGMYADTLTYNYVTVYPTTRILASHPQQQCGTIVHEPIPFLYSSTHIR